jgi:hypothetical protein
VPGGAGLLATAIVGVLKVTAADSQDKWGPYVVGGVLAFAAFLVWLLLWHWRFR